MEIVKKFSQFFNKLGKFFSSVKLLVVILLLLASTSIIGTVVPQHKSPSLYFYQYGEFFYRLFSALDIFDMYHSWWFQFLIFVLFINIVMCSINRFGATWKRVFVTTPKFNLSKFLAVKSRKEFMSQKPVVKLIKLYEPIIAKKFSYFRTESVDKDFAIFAEKGRWSALGVYIVHLSVILFLAGGLLGSTFGFDGFVTLPEGEAVKEITLKDTNKRKELGFELRCDNFEVSFYKDGSPKEYKSDLVIFENGKETAKKSIIVNDPMRYKGINIFQSSYGILSPETITLNFTSNDSRISYFKKATVGENFDMPENSGRFVIKDFTNSYKFGGRNFGESFLISIIHSNGNTENVVIPYNFKRFDMMRKGIFTISVEDYDKRYYTGLKITKDPGVPLVYIGFVVIILGIFIAFFIPYKRLCIYMTQSGSKTRVYLIGMTNKNKIGMQKRIERLANKLENQG